jgi:hypothetical protein
MYNSIIIGFGTFKKPGSGLFPFCCGFIMISFTIVGLLSPLFQKSKGENPTFNATEIKKFCFMSISFLSWGIFSQYLGYILMTAICTLIMSKIMGLKGWLIPLSLSVGTTGFCYMLFDYFLYLDLPRGLLG